MMREVLRAVQESFFGAYLSPYLCLGPRRHHLLRPEIFPAEINLVEKDKTNVILSHCAIPFPGTCPYGLKSSCRYRPPVERKFEEQYHCYVI